MCTIASTPRLPEHCVEYAKVLQWPEDKPFGGKSSCTTRFILSQCLLLQYELVCEDISCDVIYLSGG